VTARLTPEGPAAPEPTSGSTPTAAVTRQIAALADAQVGLVTHAQLVDVGLGPRSIARWLELGRLRVRHRGVYALGHTAEPPFAHEAAALLACGESAVLSHRSAALVWEFAVIPSGTAVEVTLTSGQRRSRLGLRVHRTTQLDASDITRRRGLVLTSPARTLLDNAPRLSQRGLERTFDDAIARRLLTPASVLAMLARTPGRPRGGWLTSLAAHERPSSLTRSEAEEALLALVHRAQLAQPLINANVAGYEVDFLWRQERLVVEVDGYAFHSGRGSFERDHRRDLDLRAAGFGVMRVTWRQIAEQPEYVLVRLAQALAPAPPSERAQSSRSSGIVS
jgi:very-short-patch-repair endonuclease